MGGCATKPQVLTADDNTAPVPAPAPAPELVKEESGTVSDANIVVETKEIGVVKVEEEVENGDDKVDEQGNKRRSLGLLLKESEEGKESPENEPAEAIPLEPIKQEEPVKQEEPKTENATKGSNTSIPEIQKSEIPVVEAPALVVVIATETVETKKSTEAAPGVETKKPENFEEKKAEEERGSVTATEDVKITEEA